MIKKAGLMCDDVANYVLLDYMVGDKKHWKKQFNKCMDIFKGVYNHFNEKGMAHIKHYYRYFRTIKGYETKGALPGWWEPTGRKRFIRIKERKDTMWFSSWLKSELSKWIWLRVVYDEDGDGYTEMDVRDAEEKFKNSNTYVSEFRKQFSLMKYKI
jgi:hypothetical protein